MIQPHISTLIHKSQIRAINKYWFVHMNLFVLRVAFFDIFLIFSGCSVMCSYAITCMVYVDTGSVLHRRFFGIIQLLMSSLYSKPGFFHNSDNHKQNNSLSTSRNNAAYTMITFLFLTRHLFFLEFVSLAFQSKFLLPKIRLD